MRSSRVPVKHGGGGATAPREVNSPLQSLRNEIDHVFERFAHAWPQWAGIFNRKPSRGSAEHWPAVFDYRSYPDVDIGESGSAYEITAELPGLDEKDIELLLSEGVLTLKGEKKAKREDKGRNYHLIERRCGCFRRSFTLPSGVDEKDVSAKFAKGVLTIKLPKTAKARRRQKKIEIDTR